MPEMPGAAGRAAAGRLWHWELGTGSLDIGKVKLYLQTGAVLVLLCMYY